MDVHVDVKRLVKIHPSLQKLIVSLSTKIVSDEWKLDKHPSHHDILRLD
jgi:hypothetical protein